MILYVDACARRESRTRGLAEFLLSHLADEVETVHLAELDFPRVDAAFLDRRYDCVARRDYGDPVFDLAKQFARADAIVIAAPYWDLSFPAALKQYIEQICVLGLTFRYNEREEPESLCRAQRLWVVTTAGGRIVSPAYGGGYLEAVAKTFFGVPETVTVAAEGLDLLGADVEAILRRAREEILRVLDKTAGNPYHLQQKQDPAGSGKEACCE